MNRQEANLRMLDVTYNALKADIKKVDTDILLSVLADTRKQLEGLDEMKNRVERTLKLLEDEKKRRVN